MLSDPALDRLKNSQLTKVVITDTLPLDDDRRIDKIEVLSVAGIIADALDAVFEDRPSPRSSAARTRPSCQARRGYRRRYA